MDPCAGLHILAHGSIPLPYLPNLCAVLRPAPLASYYFPFLSFPLLSPCIGLSLDTGGEARANYHAITLDLVRSVAITACCSVIGAALGSLRTD